MAGLVTLVVFVMMSKWLLVSIIILWSLVALMTIWRACSIARQWIKAETFGRFITQRQAEKAVTRSLLATMSVNRLQDTPHISVPSVAVCDSRPSHISVEVEKLAGMYDIDKMTEDINASFRGNLGGYAVTSGMITTDGLTYKFVLEDVLAIIKQRQKIMADEVQKRGKMGLKASEVGLRPVVVVADEIGSIVALMDSKQAKRFVADLVAIIQRGRSVGVSVIASTQDPSTDTLPQKIRQQFSTKILLGSANGDIQRMAFGEVATAGDVEDFRGFYTCDGVTNQPMKFYVCDLYSYGFNELEAFKKAYHLGKE